MDAALYSKDEAERLRRHSAARCDRLAEEMRLLQCLVRAPLGTRDEVLDAQEAIGRLDRAYALALETHGRLEQRLSRYSGGVSGTG
jgi:hypothetical protein